MEIYVFETFQPKLEAASCSAAETLEWRKYKIWTQVFAVRCDRKLLSFL